jgi:hypothetical protein
MKIMDQLRANPDFKKAIIKTALAFFIMFIVVLLFFVLISRVHAVGYYGEQLDHSNVVSQNHADYSPVVPSQNAGSGTYFIRYLSEIDGTFFGAYAQYYSSYNNWLNNIPLSSGGGSTVVITPSSTIVYAHYGAMTSGTDIFYNNPQIFWTLSGNATGSYKTGTTEPAYIITDDAQTAFNYNSSSSLAEDVFWLYPIDETAIRDFNNWVIGWNGFDPAQTYYITIDGRPSSTVSIPSQNFQDVLATQGEASSTAVFHKSHNLDQQGQYVEGWNGTTWYLYLRLFSDYTMTTQIGDTKAIVVDTYRHNNVSTSSLAALAAPNDYDVSSTLAALQGHVKDCTQYAGGFFSSSTLQALGCYVEQTAMNIINFLFVPDELATNFVGDSLTELKTKFPFNIVFNLASSTEAILQQSSSSISSSYETKVTIAGHQVTLVSSSTLDSMGSTNKNFFFTIISNLAYLGAGFIIFKMVLM